MKNHLRLLRKENKQRINNLIHRNNIDMLDKWMEYAKSSNINPYEYELCCKELIGIAEQKELTNDVKDLQHFFGEDQRFIADNILDGCNKKKLIDYILFDISIFCGFGAIVFITLLAMLDALFTPLSLYVVLMCFVVTIVLPFIAKIYDNQRFRHFHTGKDLEPHFHRKRTFTYIGSHIIFSVIFFYLGFIFDKTIVLPVPYIMFPLGLGILWGILKVLQLVYVDHLAKERPWEDVI